MKMNTTQLIVHSVYYIYIFISINLYEFNRVYDQSPQFNVKQRILSEPFYTLFSSFRQKAYTI